MSEDLLQEEEGKGEHPLHALSAMEHIRQVLDTLGVEELVDEGDVAQAA